MYVCFVKKQNCISFSKINEKRRAEVNERHSRRKLLKLERTVWTLQVGSLSEITLEVWPNLVPRPTNIYPIMDRASDMHIY